MSENTKIEWCDHTFNPHVGCTKISPGCDGCYAEGWAKRSGLVQWGPHAERRRTSPANWRKPLKWNANAAKFFECPGCGWRGTDDETSSRLQVCMKCSTRLEPARQRVFCASLGDVFDNAVPEQWRVDLFALIEATPNLDWLVLTKRIGNAAAMIDQAVTGAKVARLPTKTPTWPWPNVWIGATITSQSEADRDIPKLLAVPAAKRFLSMEPLLGAVNLTDVPMPEGGHGHHEFSPIITGNALKRADWKKPRIDWVIVGGESGPNARPMHPYWATGLRDQCSEAGVPFLFKQWGEWAPRAGKLTGGGVDFQALDPACERWPQVIRLGEHGKNTRICENCTPGMGEEVFVQRVGKKAAGRLLDGIEHNGFPE